MKTRSTDTPVVVIGAGIGGLSAALALKARGLPVVLLERHSTAGGKMRQLHVAGRAIDAGPTVFTMRWVFEALFERAGLRLDEQLNLHEASVLARHSWLDGSSLDLFTDISQSMDAIASFATPKEADNYRDFARRTESIFNTLDESFMRAQRPNPIGLSLSGGLKGMIDMANTQPFVSLWNHLSKNFDDPRLQQLFARYATYCGSSPFKAPATLMLIAHVERAGVSLIEGGMQALAQTLANTLDTLGVESRYDCGVSRIESSSKGVSGVVLDSGEHIATHAVIFNGDTQALATGLLGERVKQATSIRKEASLSAVTQCQVARTSGFELAHHTVFFGDDYHDEFASVFTHQTLTKKPTVYVCAQDRGGHDQHVPDTLDHERLLSLVNAPATNMSEAEKNEAVLRLQQTLAAHGLNISDEQGDTITTGPSEFANLFPATDGALYGRPTHGWMGSFNRPGSASRTQGLYLCGGSVHPGAGVPMASLSGQLAADKLWNDMARS